jgi:DNA-binding SARP family transcriptional activator
MLGSPSVYLDEHTVSHELNTKAQALLYYLVITHRTHYRNELASLFWSDTPDVQARKNLRNILPVLRSSVGSYLVITRHTAMFNRYTSYWSDVEAFEALLSRDPSHVNTEALWDAVALYSDDFLSGFYVRNAPLFEEWMLLERDRLRDMFLDTLQILATRHLDAQEYQTALDATRRLLSIEPWRESAHQQQIQALVGLGQRSAALAQYDTCCRILASEFGIAPNAATTHIYEHIKKSSFPGPQIPTLPQPTLPPDAPMHNGAAATLTTSLPMALSHDGAVIAIPGERHIIRLQSLITRSPTHLLSGHAAAITALCFCPDSTVLASASADHTVRLWSVASGALLTTFTGHSATVTAIDFSHNGRVLASASADHTVRLWDVASGALLNTLQEHQHPVVKVVFVPDGTSLVSLDTDHVIMFWNIDGEPLLTEHPANPQPVHPVRVSDEHADERHTLARFEGVYS